MTDALAIGKECAAILRKRASELLNLEYGRVESQEDVDKHTKLREEIKARTKEQAEFRADLERFWFGREQCEEGLKRDLFLLDLTFGADRDDIRAVEDVLRLLSEVEDDTTMLVAYNILHNLELRALGPMMEVVRARKGDSKVCRLADVAKQRMESLGSVDPDNALEKQALELLASEKSE
jgi:hypothetical protein